MVEKNAHNTCYGTKQYRVFKYQRSVAQQQVQNYLNTIIKDNYEGVL